MPDPEAVAKARRQYDAYAADYDRETGWYERIMLGDGRAWVGRQVRGDVLEVAVGTGRNLPHYPPDTTLVGVDLSAGMLALAHRRIRELSIRVELVQGDAQALPFGDDAFDTVVCTLGLSSIPDDQATVAEMHRVLRRDGQLVLLGHVASPHRTVRTLQHALEVVAANHQRPADSQTRDVLALLQEARFSIVNRHRSRAGIIERLVATKT